MSNGDGNGKSMGANWTALVIVATIGFVVTCLSYLLSVSSQLQAATTNIVTLQQQVQELSRLKDAQLADHGTITANSRDIEELKRRADARAK